MASSYSNGIGSRNFYVFFYNSRNIDFLDYFFDDGYMIRDLDFIGDLKRKSYI